MNDHFLDPQRIFRDLNFDHELHEEALVSKTFDSGATVPSLADFPDDKDFSANETPFDQTKRKNGSRVKQVWAIGGGKGGVGKSLISSSIAIALSRMGNEVCAIDLDLGAANLHTVLGVDQPRQTVSDLISGRVSRLDDCRVRTGIPNLSLIAGAQDSIGITNLTPQAKSKVIESLREIDADFVVVDLGAGTHNNTLDFFISADLGLVAILPEPTSIENAYRFIKAIYFRRLRLSPRLSSIHRTVDAALDSKNPLGIRTPSDLFREVSRTDPEAAMRLKEEIDRFRPKLIVNQTRTQSDIDIGFSIKSVCKKYFGIEMDYLGYLDYDNSVWQSIRRKKPIFTEFPNSKIVSSIDRIVHFVVKRYGHVRNYG